MKYGFCPYLVIGGVILGGAEITTIVPDWAIFLKMTVSVLMIVTGIYLALNQESTDERIGF